MKSGLKRIPAALVGILAVSTALAVAAPPSSQPSSSIQPKDETTSKEPAAFKPYVSRGWGVRPESEPPGYVRTLDETGLPGMEDFDWLELGLEQRTRWEYRDDYPRRETLARDNQFLMRSRGYVGVRKILDPFRLGFEFQDSQQFNSNYAEADQDVDEADVLQLFGELYFEDALGPGRPIRLQVGRMSFDYIDRRLVARNNWRNTTNAFDGFRLQLGQPDADWQFDFFALQPVERRLVKPDRSNEERWFYGLVGAWRRWAKIVTIQPYWFILDEDRKGGEVVDREIHTMGLYVFGPVGETGFDYDVDTAFQFGPDGDRDQRAFAMRGDVGYNFKHPWKPMVSLLVAYASGDRDPDDSLNERFDRLFGSSHSFSMQNLLTWQNLISTKLLGELRPTRKLRFFTGYGPYWLASDTDSWPAIGRRDSTGESGDFLGQELEVAVRYEIDPRVELELGYSHFMPGPFLGNTGASDDIDFFYAQTTFRLFK